MRKRSMLVTALGALAICSVAWAQETQGERSTHWREDIALARTDFLSRDRSFSDTNRARAEVWLMDLEAQVDRLSDQEILARLAQAAAMSGNAHTRAYILRNRGHWRRYPIRIWKFADEWRVVAARPEHARLVGARLVSVSGVPIEQAEEGVRSLFAGNDSWARYMAAYSLTSPDALIGVGAIDAEGPAPVAFDIDGESVELELATEPFEVRNRPEEAWWFLSPSHPTVVGWVHVLTSVALPPSLAGAAENYRFVRCAGEVAYLQFNRAQNLEGGPSVAEFGAGVLASLAAEPPQRLVVDLRFNTGGDLTLGGHFIRDLARSPFAQIPGRVSVMVGPNTFSAGITHVVQLQQDAQVTLAGTAPGDGLEFWSEGGNVTLPNSGVNMHYADRAHTYSSAVSSVAPDLVALDLNVDEVNPDLPADWTWDAYREGRDPYVEAALGEPLRCD